MESRTLTTELQETVSSYVQDTTNTSKVNGSNVILILRLWLCALCLCFSSSAITHP